MTELADHCKLPVPTVHRILGVLERFGYVSCDPDTRAYRLGHAAAGLVHSTPNPAELRRVALLTLRSLRSAAGERVLLSALAKSRDRGIRAGDLRSGADHPDAFPPIDGRGSRELYAPLHAGASFKVLLAQMAAEEVDAVVRRELDRIGPRTIIDSEQAARGSGGDQAAGMELLARGNRGGELGRRGSGPLPAERDVRNRDRCTGGETRPRPRPRAPLAVGPCRAEAGPTAHAEAFRKMGGGLSLRRPDREEKTAWQRA